MEITTVEWKRVVEWKNRMEIHTVEWKWVKFAIAMDGPYGLPYKHQYCLHHNNNNNI